MQSYFIFKNIDSRDMGIMVNKLPTIYKAAKNIDKVEVQGRDGFLTMNYGSYKGILKSIECTTLENSDIDKICAWLDDSGHVIFSNEEDKIYKATIINQIPFDKIARQYHRFIVMFDCQPFKYSMNNSIIMLMEPGTILNPSYVPSKPKLKIYGNESINVNINNEVIELTNITGYVVIDSELMDCYKDDILMNNNMYGDFPLFKEGTNNISWTGDVEKIEITPNWRYL